MSQDLNEGKVTSKLEGANWAKEKLDQKWRNLIDYCWKQRQDPNISIKQSAEEGMYEQSIEFVKYIVDQAKTLN